MTSSSSEDELKLQDSTASTDTDSDWGNFKRRKTNSGSHVPGTSKN